MSLFKNSQSKDYSNYSGSGAGRGRENWKYAHDLNNKGIGGTFNSSEAAATILRSMYPPAVSPAPCKINPAMRKRLEAYNSMSNFFKNNYCTDDELLLKSSTALPVDRFTDQYKSPLSVVPYLLHYVGSSRYHDDLNASSLASSIRKKSSAKDIKGKNFEDLPDDDDDDDDDIEDAEGFRNKFSVSVSSAPDTMDKLPKKGIKEMEENDASSEPIDDEGDVENDEENDDEISMGWDYCYSYFENGEENEDAEGEVNEPVF